MIVMHIMLDLFGSVVGIIILVIAIYLILHLIHSMIKATIVIVVLVVIMLFVFGFSSGLTGVFDFMSDRTDVSIDGVSFNFLDSEKAVVTEVTDGDTVVLESGDKVRLLGINSPEKGQPCSAEATAKLTELVLDKEVTLIAGSEDVDIYGRLLRYIVVDEDVFVNAEMVKFGFAHVYAYGEVGKYISVLDAAQADAMEEYSCMWSLSEYTGCIAVAQFEYDASGDDNDNLNEEYVILENSCSEIDMNGWTLKDESASNMYTFSDFILDENVAIYSGVGEDTETDIYWGRKQAVWNNDGDRLFLRDTEGNLVLSESYSAE
jgi:micrococcal nuclease